MSFILSVFKNLRTTYSSWDSLKAHFTSQGLQIKEETDSNFAIVYYRHGSDVSEDTKWFRSVVWDKVSHIPVSISTARAAADDALMWSTDKFEGNTITEYLDGVTLNLFRGGGNSSDVIVSSRTRLGAGVGFYNKTSFQQMLADAVKEAGFDSVSEFYEKHTTESTAFLTVLVQHPEHRIVEKVDKARVYILQRGSIKDDGDAVIELYPSNELMPKKYEAASSPAISEWFESLVNANTWSWRGVCISNGHGNRWRIHSTVYKMIRSLRGNTSRADERFFTLRAAGMVKTYLQYYPEESNLFWKYEKWTRAATKLLYGYYVAVYKSHELTLDGVDARWHTHLGAIHHMYMGQLKPSGNGVHMSHVVAYMNALPTPRLLFLMNLDKRNKAGASV